ncbi:MAG: hypothetical protein HC838_08360 [Spirulinaceae cyanobacterium RM2_2_10]|nr:hypothetical protein [Spirulinaceae cyanobacterium SM2_1_0]NJO20055.1 hypothetical protein [Spirulinaceae cyanobacterium RM2_2_10]
MRITPLSLLAGAAFTLAATAALAEVAVANPRPSVQLAQVDDMNEPRLRGIVRSVVGNQVLVELERTEMPFEWIGMSRSELGALNIMGGTPVYVQGGRIIGLAYRGTPTPRTSDFTSRTQALWADYERSLNEPNAPAFTPAPSTDFSQPVPAPVPVAPPPAPIQGLW